MTLLFNLFYSVIIKKRYIQTSTRRARKREKKIKNKYYFLLLIYPSKIYFSGKSTSFSCALKLVQYLKLV